jgi:acetyl esterase/lipase
MRWPAALAPLMTLLGGACSPVAMLNVLAPSQGIVKRYDIPYAAGSRAYLDVYAPEPGNGIVNHPVVVFFYGGGWDSGDRSLYRFVGAELAARGVVVVIPDYRLYPEVRFPAFMEDAAQAVAWAGLHSNEYGGDAKRMFLMGHSAGAQIATLLALDGAYLQAAGFDRGHIAGVIGLAGPYDFLPLESAELKAIFGPEETWKYSQPINYVRPGAPPMLLVAGSDDSIVDPRNTEHLAARLRSVGDTVTATIYPDVSHKTLIGAFAGPLTFVAPVRRDVLDFISAHAEAVQ